MGDEVRRAALEAMQQHMSLFKAKLEEFALMARLSQASCRL
jgi:hypothetical protein